MRQKFVLTILLPLTLALQCDELLLGQFHCDQPEIDITTQAIKDCNKNKTVNIRCYPVNNIQCEGVQFQNNTIGFYKEIPCKFVGSKSFKVSLLLSIFLGVFGIDRFYLGYPAIGLFKLCTLGFFMIFQFIDVILIATQALKPADGSDYYMDYFDHQIIHINKNNDTYWLPP